MFADWTNISGGNTNGKHQKTEVAWSLNTQTETYLHTSFIVNHALSMEDS